MLDIKLMVICPNPDDATSFYRGAVPIGEMTRRYPLSPLFVDSAKTSTMSYVDAVFLQRPYTDHHLQIAQLAQKMGRKLWIDHDDNLFAVPDDNPSHALYSHEQTQHNVATMVAMADAVTVSTQVLAGLYNDIRRRAGKPPCVVVPNALSDHFIDRRPQHAATRRKAIFWRGSPTHQLDLMTATEPLLYFLEKHQDWSIHFMGYNPFWITRKLSKDRCVVAPAIDILDYHDYLAQIQPGICFVPLHDSEFCRGKSNIAWLETTFGHAQCVAPNFQEWRMPGISNYTSPDFIYAALHEAARSVESCDYSPVYASWRHIRNTLTLSQTNEKRWEVLQSLCPSKSNREKGENNAPQSYVRHYGGCAPAAD